MWGPMQDLAAGPNARTRHGALVSSDLYDVIVFSQPCYDRRRAQIYSAALTRQLRTFANVREEIC